MSITCHVIDIWIYTCTSICLSGVYPCVCQVYIHVSVRCLHVKHVYMAGVYANVIPVLTSVNPLLVYTRVHMYILDTRIVFIYTCI